MVSSARAKITPKPKKAPAKKTAASKPAAKPAAPPKVDVPVTVDMSAVAQAIAGMSAEMRTVVEALMQRIDALEDRQDELLKAIAAIKPTVNMPARPSAFRVEIDGGEKVMEISAIRPN